MSKSQPVTQTQNTSTSIPAWLTSYAKQAGAEGANLPQYTAYTGPNVVAGLSPDQLQALGFASGNAGAAGAIASSGAGAANALTGYNNPVITAGGISGDTSALMNPYIQSVIDAAGRGIDISTQQAQNQSDNQFAAQHAFGGDRQGVASGVIASQGAAQKAQLISQLMSQGYNTATATALAEQQANQQAAQGAAGVRLGGVNALTGLGTALAGINASDLAGLLSAGGVQQQTQSGQNQFGYQQYLNQFQIPDQQAQAFAAILGSLPHGTSQTGTSTQMSYSNPLLGLGGLGLAIGGMGTGGGATLGGTALSGLGSAAAGGLSSLGSAALPLLGLLSDRRMKRDIKMIGQLYDGTPVYRFRYTNDGENGPMHIGLMAQDVERATPEAVTEVEGVKFVDYEKATQLAVDMGGEQK